MLDEDSFAQDDGSEELLRRALLDDSASVAVSLRVGGLPVSEAVTVIFHGRRDLGTLQTYVTSGSLGAGTTVVRQRPAAGAVRPRPRRRRGPRRGRAALPGAGDRAAGRARRRRRRARRVARAARRAGRPARSRSTTRSSCRSGCPPRGCCPTALVARDAQLVVTPVCSARTLAEGRPPMGIACAQQDVTRVYPARRRPRALRRGLPRGRRRARAGARRAARAPGGLGRALPGASVARTARGL